MRKSIFFAIALLLVFIGFGADAAVARRGTSGGTSANNNTNTVSQQSAVSARAGRRQTVVSNIGAGNVAARSATKQTKTGVVAARAGATQKVINTGTKVAAATENITVPEECQNAYYGCMDAFCMLDNATGGRCQCNDRITELDAVLEDILRLDEQSYIMATEGVERIQMGEAESTIMARAKSAGDAAVADNKNELNNKKKSRTLDLSVFNNSIFTEMDEDVFDTQSSLLADKKGTALFNETSRLCSAQMPQQCKSYNSMLSLVYAQKIKSDCMAYENSLKAQKNQSQQKLQTAQKALRDAALEEYQNQNKYATTGECVVAFTRCMQTTAECGEDYTGCVTLAARENMSNIKNGSAKAKQTKIKGAVSGADITLAASTMEALFAKKEICEHITKQCVNSNRNNAVWNVFLRNAAPALKSAELIAEQDLRSNCIPTVAECYKNSCKSQFGEDDESYDMCLSSPATYKALCKVQLEPCLEATGGSFEHPEKSTLWNGLVAMLNAMKVDACTKEIKDCLTERCGKDYSECIGLDSETIVNICPYQKLTACMGQKNDDGTPYYEDETAIREYVAKIAQGLAIQIDNSLATVCQNAANEAMIKVCGDTETCENVMLDLSPLESGMSVKICDNGTTTNSNCYTNVAMTDVDTLKDKNVRAVLIGAVDTSGVTFGNGDTVAVVDASKMSVIKPDAAVAVAMLANQSNNSNTNNSTPIRFFARGKTSAQLQTLVNLMNTSLDRVMTQINSDPKVIYCREGRQVQGFDGSKFGKKKGDTDDNPARFPNLTNEYENTVASALLNTLSVKNIELKSKFDEQIAAIDKEIIERVYASDQAAKDVVNEAECARYAKKDYNDWRGECNNTKEKDGGTTEKGYADLLGYKSCQNNCKHRLLAPTGVSELVNKEAVYDSDTNTCTVTTKTYKCTSYRKPLWCQKFCDAFDAGTVTSTSILQMAK